MYKKIDLFFDGKYLCSTNNSKTCKQAKERYIANAKYTKEYFNVSANNLDKILANTEKVKAYFDKNR